MQVAGSLLPFQALVLSFLHERMAELNRGPLGAHLLIPQHLQKSEAWLVTPILPSACSLEPQLSF